MLQYIAENRLPLGLCVRYVSGFLARYMKTKPGSSRDGLGFYADIQNLVWDSVHTTLLYS